MDSMQHMLTIIIIITCSFHKYFSGKIAIASMSPDCLWAILKPQQIHSKLDFQVLDLLSSMTIFSSSCPIYILFWWHLLP